MQKVGEQPQNNMQREKNMILTKEERERYAIIWEELKEHYDEKDRRLLAAAMTKSLGRGGQKEILGITKLNADTVKLGTEQLNGIVDLPADGNRRAGGGRKQITEIYPNVEEELLKLVETNTQGDPESPLLWTSKSLENLSRGLQEKGYSVSLPTISGLLVKNGYSMQANKKRFEGINQANEAIEKYPDIEEKMNVIVDEMCSENSTISWTKKEIEELTKALNKKEYEVTRSIVSDLLEKNGLKEETKIDRDSQFKYINEVSKEFIKQGNPVISVDGKKKENIGNFKNNGKEYAPIGKPVEVNAYDFVDKEKGKVTPYGIFDFLRNDGWVNVGTDYDTAEFSVESIRKWWYKMGMLSYPDSSELLINADSGGSNSAVSRLWKVEIQKFSDEINIPITVCHFPPGTSKWNKIEHRMFSAISMNWRGRPLVSHEVVVNLIAGTTNKSGLKIQCELDLRKYKKGIKITDEELSDINIKYHEINSKYNYTIYPRTVKSQKN